MSSVDPPLSARRARLTPWLVVAIAASCRPGAGSSCEKGEARCLGGALALTCESGAFVETPCRGARGCRTDDRGTACDVSGNQPGDRCSRDDEGTAACADAGRLLTCRDGRYEVAACRGPRGCSLEGARATCDASVARPGDACRDGARKACAEDASAVLGCAGGKWSPLYPCRGPKRCEAANGSLKCDMTLAEAGDACDPKLDGHVACRGDLLATAVCEKGRFVAGTPCKAGSRCVASEGRTRCEHGD